MLPINPWFISFWLLFPFVAQAAPPCPVQMAKVLSSQGKVEYQRQEDTRWQKVIKDTEFCPGDKIRVSRHSRAALLLNSGATVVLDQNTTLVFMNQEKKASNWILNILNGSTFFRSRLLQQLEIRTPFINAVHEGTEFLVTVRNKDTEITVFDGQVAAENAAGKIQIPRGFVGSADSNRPPQLRPLTIRPEDAVQWTLYYPPLVEAQTHQDPDRDDLPSMLISALRQNDIPQALTELDVLIRSRETSRLLLIKAALLLSVGRVDEVVPLTDRIDVIDPGNSAALALQAVIAVTKNRREKAFRLAQQAVTQDPQSAAAHLALSYAYQAGFEIEHALEAAQTAARLSPDNALAWARVSELQLSSGNQSEALKAAQQAETLNPDLARTQMILGFAHLAQVETDEAKQAFERAVTRDAAEPVARLGLGLAKIRQGDLEDGTRDLESAVTLDPNNAVARSYLGKAYYELRNNNYAGTELAIAKEMDPRDPTPWFYDAIVKQTSNRPVEALHDMQKAIELNDNRGVYRSRLLLDEDAAARAANQARIYSDLGFGRVALSEAWKSLAYDSKNDAVHRNLADAYFGQPRFRIARASELLQAQLLQPVNITPVQPQLTAENIGILNNTGPSSISVNEYDPLFTANGAHILLNGAYGSNNTLTDNAVISGVYNQLSMSLGQFHFQTDGFRQNDDFKQDIYDAFVQYAVNPDLSFQFELKSEDVRAGDVPFRLNGFHQENLRKTIEHDTARVGGRYQISPNQNLIFSTFYTTVKDNTHEDTRFPHPQDASFTVSIPRTLETLARGWQTELQYQLDTDSFDVIGGFGYLNLRNDLDFYRIVNILTPSNSLFSSSNELSLSAQNQTDYLNGYIYTRQKIASYFNTTLGISFDNYNDGFINLSRVNPKIGAILTPFKDLTFRAAVLRALNRPLAAGQTIEPTQVAGFNQSFDGNNGSLAWQYSLGIDYVVDRNIYFGGEASWRSISEHIVETNPGSFSAFERDRNESSYLAYFYWTPADWLAFRSEYSYEKISRDYQINQESITDPQRVETQQLPLTISLFHDKGLFARLAATFVSQAVTTVSDKLDTESESFWTFDSMLGYRLPRKLGTIGFEVRNMFDNDFNYQSIFDASGPQLSPFVPEREFFVKLSLFY